MHKRCINSTISDMSSIPSIPKKRGRPVKVLANKVSVPKKRGRPAKVLSIKKLEQQRQTLSASALKEEDLIWGDLSDDDDFYKSFKKPPIKKRKITDRKKIHTTLTVIPNKVVITSDIIINILHKTGLDDIHRIDNMYILYKKYNTYNTYNNMAGIYTTNNNVIGFYIVNDIDLLSELTEEEKIFVMYLDKELINTYTNRIKKIYLMDLLYKINLSNCKKEK